MAPRWLTCSIALLATGCVADVTFDPRGAAASAEGAWLVGAEPASAETCGALGASYVRVRFFDGERTHDHPNLVFPCAAGAFDTRPDRVVAEGTWTIALIAIDAEGNALAAGTPETHDTTDSGGHLVLGSVDFVPGD